MRIAVGRVIRRHRDRAGISQEELAHRAGVHRTYMGGIERGERNLSLINLCRISSALELPLSSLFLEAEDMIARPSDKA